MNATQISNDVACEFQPPADFGGVSWVGPNFFEQGFCLGSETGNIVLTNAAFQPRSEVLRASSKGEAVASVAYSRKWLAVMTRKDINFVGPLPPTDHPTEMVTFFCGGRDVIVAPISEHFVIPLGPEGIMFVKPGIGENDPVTISKSEKSDLNFCRVVALPGVKESDVIVCAGRRGGLGYSHYREGIRGHTLHTVTYKDMDFVDVCSIATPDRPLAVVAAAKNGSLVFFQDILADKSPKTIKFKGIPGTVYRVLSLQGDIYLLTSNGLFGLFRLAAQYLEGEAFDHVTTDILRMSVEAADANIVAKKWLLAVGVESVFRIDLEKLPKSPDEDSTAENNGDLQHDEESTTKPALTIQQERSAPNGREQPELIRNQPRWAESSFDQRFESISSKV